MMDDNNFNEGSDTKKQFNEPINILKSNFLTTK